MENKEQLLLGKQLNNGVCFNERWLVKKYYYTVKFGYNEQLGPEKFVCCNRGFVITRLLLLRKKQEDVI